MFHKLSVFPTLATAYLFLSSCLISSSLTAQSPTTATPSPIPPPTPKETPSNLITNNPFVPQNNESLNQPKKNPTGPQSIANKPQVLQKYLQFKSIAIINKKKYFSIFNKRTNKSFWISENETIENFRVTNYNPESNSITISDGINTELISIITANEAPVNIVNATTQPNNQDTVNPPVHEATSTQQNNNKPNTPLRRRRVIPVKR